MIKDLSSGYKPYINKRKITEKLNTLICFISQIQFIWYYFHIVDLKKRMAANTLTCVLLLLSLHFHI